MGKIYGSRFKKKETPWTYSAGVKEKEDKLREYSDIARRKDIELPSVKQKPSILDRFLGFVSAAETAPAAYEYLKTKDTEKALKKYLETAKKRATFEGLGENISYSDVLKELGMKEDKIVGPVSARGLTGLALDIGLDPMTYLGGFLAKGAKKVIKPLTKGVTKLPVVGKKVKAVKETAEELFKPFAKIKRLPKGAGEEYAEKTFKPFVKGLRYEQREAIESIAGLSGKAKKKYGKDIGEKLTEAIEKGELVGKAGDAQGFIEEMFRGVATSEKARGLLKEELPQYVRHLITPEARKYLDAGGAISSSYYKPLRVSLKSAKHRGLTGTISELNKGFAEKHGFNLFEPDVFKALAGRKIESLRAIRTYDFLKEVEEKFGTQAPKNVDKLMKDGVEYTAFYPKGGIGVTGEKVLLPKPITEHLNETIKTLTNDEATNKFLKTYDKVLQTWKGSVTGRFPAFHGRNALGGVFNNYIAGVKNPARYLQADKLARQTDEVITLAGKKYSYKELGEILAKRGATGGQGWLDIMGSIDKEAKKALAKPVKGYLQKVTDALPGESWMNFVETRLRGSLFIDQLAKGKNIDDAVNSIFKYHFDYSPEGLTYFEKTFMRRIIPFYRFMRGNIPLQFEQMIKQPAKYAGISKTLRSVQKGTETERGEAEMLPEYMRKSFPIRLGGNAKEVNYLYGLGLPIEQLGQLTVSGVLANLSPILKVPIELATDKHFYFDKPLHEVKFAPKLIQQAPKVVRDLFDYEEIKSGDRTYHLINPIKMHIFNSAFGRGFWTVEKLTDPKTQTAIKLLYAVLGLKGKSVDVQQQKYYRKKEQAKKLEEFLYGKGALKKFTSYYE